MQNIMNLVRSTMKYEGFQDVNFPSPNKSFGKHTSLRAKLSPDLPNDYRQTIGKALYLCFCLNFDDIWQIVGYSRKDVAKAKLLSRKLGLKRNEDYRITLPDSREHNREDIWLTARAFSQFALAAQTDDGAVVRDFLLYLTMQVKTLMTNLQSGNVRLVPGGKTESEHDANRLKASASQESLTGVLDSIEFTTGQTYFRVNGETNRIIVTGSERNQLDEADELSEIQLAAANLGEIMSARKLASGELQSDVDVIRSHRLFTPEALKKIQSDKLPSKLTIQGAKRANVIENKPSTSTSHNKQKTTQYFGSRV